MSDKDEYRDALEDFAAIATFATQMAQRLNYKETRASIFRRAENVRRALTNPAPPTVPEDAPAAFVHWLVREMPPGTTIGNPGWWTPKIWREVRRALAQHSEPGRIPEGYCLVPVIPTIEMAHAADKAMEETRGSAKSDCNRAILAYKRILAAAPAPDADEQEGG